MTTINVHEAETRLSSLLDRALAGEEVVIARGGRPLVRLMPVTEAGSLPPRVPGQWKGRVRLAEDFDELPDEMAAAFRGERP